MSTPPNAVAAGPRETVPVLLVEDNEAHAQLVLRAFEDDRTVSFHHVLDGEQALDYLHRRGEHADAALAPRPRLILLDLRLPRVDGIEVLADLKSDHDLRTIPVVVLTSSSNPEDLANAYRSHANSYLVKPLDFDRFARLLRTLARYWIHCNEPPPGEARTGSG